MILEENDIIDYLHDMKPEEIAYIVLQATRTKADDLEIARILRENAQREA
jgi:hypothetical protein